MQHCVTWGPSSLSPKGAQPPIFGQCPFGQAAAWTKMPLGMELGLGPGDFVFDRDPATPRKKGTPTHPIFCSCLLWPNGPGDVVLDGVAAPPKRGTAPQFSVHVYCGWMDEDTTWYGSRTRPRPHCIRRGPSSPRKGHSTPSLFSPCLLWPRPLISATAKLMCHFWATFAICYRTVRCLSVCNVGVCGQTVRWIKMALGRKAGLGPGVIALDGDLAPPRKGAQQPPSFGRCLFWLNGWMDQPSG